MMKSSVLLIAALGVSSLSFAQASLPFNIDFEPPAYSTTGGSAGNGVIYDGMSGQDGWGGGGAYFVRTDQPFQGLQSCFLNNSVIFGITGSTFNGWKNYVAITSGTMVVQGWLKIATDPGGRSAFSLEMFANSGANRIISIGVNDLGELHLRPRSSGGTAAGVSAFKASNPSVDPTAWNKLMGVYDVDTKRMRGFVNNQPLIDPATSQPMEWEVTDLAVTAMNDMTIGSVIGDGANRRAYSIASTDPRGTDSAYWDNLRCENFQDNGVIRCGVVLNSYLGAIDGRAVEVEVVGTSTEVTNTTLNALSEFLVTSTLREPVEIAVKPVGFLRKRVTGVDLTDTGVFHLEFSCINGDVDNNNEIGPGDFSLLANAFGSENGDPGYLAAADLDGNDEVGPSDFAILSSNFGLEGD